MVYNANIPREDRTPADLERCMRIARAFDRKWGAVPFKDWEDYFRSVNGFFNIYFKNPNF